VRSVAGPAIEGVGAVGKFLGKAAKTPVLPELPVSIKARKDDDKAKQKPKDVSGRKLNRAEARVKRREKRRNVLGGRTTPQKLRFDALGQGGLRLKTRSKKERQKTQRAIEKQDKRVDSARARAQFVRHVRERVEAGQLPDSRRTLPLPTNKKQQQRVRQRTNASMSAYLGDSNVGKTLRRAGQLPQGRVPTPQEGGRTVAEANRAIEEAASKGKRPSISNITVAKGEWRRAGGLPKVKKGKYKGEPNMKYVGRVAEKVALPQAFDRRGVTAEELLRDPETTRRYVVEDSRATYEQAAKDNKPVGRANLNPWAISDAQAPPNETPEQKRKRELEVADRMAREGVAKGLQGAEIFDAAAAQERFDAARGPDGVAGFLGTDKYERAFKSGVEKVERVIENPRLGLLELSQPTAVSGQEVSDQLGIAADILLLRGVGRLGGGTLRTGKTFAAGATAKTELGTIAGYRGGLSAVLSSSAIGRKYLGAVGALDQNAWRAVRGVTGAGLTGAAINYNEYTVPIVEGIVTANVPKATAATARALIAAITEPIAIAAALGLTTKRSIDAIGEEDPYYESVDYITAPVTRLAEETWKEIKEMAETLTSKDAARIRKMTENDLGYISVMSAAWVSRLTVGQTIRSTGSAISSGAKQIARTPAGLALAKQIRETPGLGRAVAAGQVGIANTKSAWEKRQDRIKAQLVSGRIVGEAEFLTAKMEKDVVTAKQAYNSADSATGSRVGRAVNRFNKAIEREFVDAGDETSIPPRVDVEDVAVEIVTRGIDVVNPSEAQVIRQMRELRDGLERNSYEYRALSLAIQNPRIWRMDGSLRSKAFARLLNKLGKNDKLMSVIRARGQEGTQTGERQMLTDREVRATEVFETVAKVTGGDRPVGPRDEMAAERKAEEAELDQLEESTQQTRKTAERLSGELGVAREALEAELEAERVQINRELRGTELGDELGSAADRLLAVTVREEVIPDMMKDNNREVVAIRRELKYGSGSQTKKRKAELEARIAELKAENVELAKMRSEANNAKARLKYLKKKARQTSGKVSPTVAANAKRVAEYERKLKGLTGQKAMVRYRELRRKIYGDQTPEERELTDLRAEPVVQAARQRKDGLEESIRTLREDIATKEFLQRLIGDIKELLDASPATKTEFAEGVRELETLYEAASRREKAGDGAAEPTLAQQIGDPEAAARFFKEEFGIDIPEAEVKRAAREQLNALGEYVSLLKDVNDLVTRADGGRGERRRLKKDLDQQDQELTAQLSNSEKSLDRLTKEQETVIFGTGDEILAEARQAERDKIKQSIADEQYKALVERYEVDAARARAELGLENPAFISHRREDPSDAIPVPPEATGPLATARERRREGDLEGEGLVDRSWLSLNAAYRAEIQRQTYKNISQYIVREGLVGIRWDDGTIRTVFAQSELEQAQKLYKAQHGVSLESVAFIMDRRTFDEAGRFGAFMGDAGSGSGFLTTSKLDKERVKSIENANVKNYRDGIQVHVIHDPGFDSIERRAARAADPERGEDGFVLVKQATLDTFRKLQADMTDFEKLMFQFNRISSRLVLGTSLAWMLAQPFAEMAVLLAQHPVRGPMAFPKVAEIRRKGGEAAVSLARVAQSPVGPNPATSRRAAAGVRPSQRDWQKATAFAKALPFFNDLFDPVETAGSMRRGLGKQTALDVAWLRAPGIFDRWKGSWIREAGVLAEMDYSLSQFVSAGKAVRGQMDLIEANSGKLRAMSTEEQLKWLNSQEGFDVGMELAKKIDDQLGNWQDLRPGLEAAVGQVIFFYPFVRYSLKWALQTYPRDHPVVWSLANVMGVANVEMLEELINYEAAWPQEWAVVPIFGDPADDSKPAHLISAGRYTTAGNALTELAIDGGDPLWNAANVAVPLWGILGRAYSGLDEYGQKLRDKDDDFMSPNAGGRTRAGAFLDQIASLTTFYREYRKQTGFGFQNLLDSSSDSAFGFVPELGRDPGWQGNISAFGVGIDIGWRDFLRRNLIPAIPMPTHVVQDKQQYARIMGRMIAARGARQKYEFEGKSTIPVRGPNGKWREIKFADVGKYLIGRRKEGDKIGVRGGWHFGRSEREQKIAKEFLRIQDENKWHTDQLDKSMKAMRELHYRNDFRIDPDSAAWRDKMDKQMTSVAKRWFTEWDETFPGLAYPKSEEEAKRALRAADNAGVAFNDRARGLPRTDNATDRKPLEEGEKLSTRLRNATRQRLEESGKRRVSIDDAANDPETRVGKKGFVTRYRGEKVAGKATLAELQSAEANNALDVDRRSGLLRSPRIQEIQEGQRQLARDAKAKRRTLDRLTTDDTGMPSNVPKEYAKWIRKYSPRIENIAQEMYGMSGNEFMAKMLQGESGFDMNKVGPDTPYGNARGAAQFIPGTRRDFIRDFGIDPWSSVKEAVQAMALHLDGKSYAKKPGIQGYNPGINDSYYLEQDVGQVTGGKKVSREQLKEQQKALKELEESLAAANKTGKEAGLEPVRAQRRPTLWAQPKRAKGEPRIEWLNGTSPEGINPDIIRLARTVSRMTGHNIQITSALRRHSTGSNHQVGGALDINALAQSAGGTAETEKMGDAIAYASVIAAGGSKEDAQALASGAVGYVGFVSPNGQPVEFLWKGDGAHRDHVHIAVESGQQRGKPVFRGRKVIGPGVLSDGFPNAVTSGGGGGYGGGGGMGGGSVVSGGMMDGMGAADPMAFTRSGTAASWRDEPLVEPDEISAEESYERGGVMSAVESLAKIQGETGSDVPVESMPEEPAQLPKVRKKRTVPRFGSNR
jgi:hypothetical protein